MATSGGSLRRRKRPWRGNDSASVGSEVDCRGRRVWTDDHLAPFVSTTPAARTGSEKKTRIVPTRLMDRGTPPIAPSAQTLDVVRRYGADGLIDRLPGARRPHRSVNRHIL